MCLFRDIYGFNLLQVGGKIGSHPIVCKWKLDNNSVFVLQARLYSLQADPATYCNEPDGKIKRVEILFFPGLKHFLKDAKFNSSMLFFVNVCLFHLWHALLLWFLYFLMCRVGRYWEKNYSQLLVIYLIMTNMMIPCMPARPNHDLFKSLYWERYALSKNLFQFVLKVQTSN